MEEKRKAYEPPTVTVYQFDDSDLILTASSTVDDPAGQLPEYAANALNQYLGGINTTVE